MIKPVLRSMSLILLSGAFLGACSDNDNNSNNAQPFSELFDQGVTRYMGVYTPMSSETHGDTVQHAFGAGDGPLCLRGGEYAMATRDKGSAELLIFLEGGGACWSDLCAATSEASAVIPPAGINDPERPDNPTRTWSQVYVPYCDGSLHSGDRDWDDDGDGQTDRFHRGLHNLSAALDVAVTTFPSPSRIVLAGNSGGGLGTVFALPLVRFLYPDVPIDVINDSGIGVSKPGKPEFLMQLMEEWGQEAFIPASCENCIGADGHLTDYLIWQLDQDDDTRLALLSYTQDSVFADTFLAIGGPAFETAMLQELGEQEAAHPERVRSFIPIGTGHTFVQLEPDKAIGGTSVMQWLDAMLNSPEQWSTLNELTDSP
ncbi:MAG: hypothetical protein Hals2KO_09070 [Halioglobus sp.]